jgi:hypothetical protein
MRKTALKIGLLLFVAASIAAAMFRGYESQAGKPDVPLAGIAPERQDAVVVCYLRSRFRCPACATLEACSRDTVEQQFAAEAVAGTLVWKVVDYQTPGNEHFVSDFQLPTGGIVLVEFRGGKPVRWKPLLHAWNLTDNRKNLASYLEQSIREFRDAKGDSPIFAKTKIGTVPEFRKESP